MTAVDHAELKRESRAPLPPEILADALGRIWTDEVFEVGERLIHGDNLIAMAVERLRAHAALLSEIEGLKAERDAYWDAKAAFLWGYAKGSGGGLSSGEGEWSVYSRALRTQAPDSWRPDREAVAHEIYDFLGERFPEGGLPGGVQVFADDPVDAGMKHEAGCQELADRILALRPQTADKPE